MTTRIGINISQSDIAKLKQGCLRQALLCMGDRYSRVGPSRVGQASHAMMGAYVTHLRETKQESDVAWARSAAEKVCVSLSFNDEMDLRSFIFRAIDQVDLSWVPSAVAVFVEERFHIDVETLVVVQPLEVGPRVALGDTIFSGTPDVWWIDQQMVLHVLDWKSGHVIDHVEELSQNYQLRLYSGALLAAGEMTVAAFGHICHLRHSALVETSGWSDPDTPPVPWGRDLVPWMQSVVMAAADELRGREPTQDSATYGGHCINCDVRGGCRTYAARVAVDSEIADATPEMLLTNGKILKARGEEMLGILREKMDVLGSVSDGHFTATIKAVTKRSEWKASAFVELREMLTEDELARVCQPTKTRLESIFRKKKVADMLESFCEKHMDKQLDTELNIKVTGKRQNSPPPPGESTNSGSSPQSSGSDDASS